eukprot:c11222_g1_i3.p1 GENE.c11222_g1_i3~~c11222_g1_i3.p1  ORF type:complete len:119 (-),score=30.13 c11222_g1_i3:452-808(-)
MLSLLLDTAKSMVVTVDELSECYKEAANDIKNLEKDGCVSVAHGFVRASNYAITIDPELKIQWNLIKLPNHGNLNTNFNNNKQCIQPHTLHIYAHNGFRPTKRNEHNFDKQTTQTKIL